MGCKNSNLKNAIPPWIILPLSHLLCNWNSQGAKYFLFLTHLLNSHELTEWGYFPPALKVSLMTKGCLGFWLMHISAFLYKMQKVETGRYTQIFLLPLRQIACFLLPLITFLFLILFLFFFFFFCKFFDSCNRHKVMFSFLWLHAPLFTFLFNRYFSGRLRGVVSMAGS